MNLQAHGNLKGEKASMVRPQKEPEQLVSALSFQLLKEISFKTCNFKTKNSMPLSLLCIRVGSASFLRIHLWSFISSSLWFAGPANAKKCTLKKCFKAEKRDKIQESVDRFQLSHIENYEQNLEGLYNLHKPQYFSGGPNSLRNKEHYPR